MGRLIFLALLVFTFGGVGCFNADTTAAIDNNNMPDKADLTGKGPFVSKGLDRSQLSNKDVLQAMSRVPRHRFVPEEVRSFSYEDKALPIGSGQTISQPFIVALMTQEAHVGEGSKVLEIGTGSGFQAAVLAELGARVFSIEIVPELAATAGATLKELGYKNVVVKQGDGWEGWPEEAPFDAILVTASAPRPPEKLLSQLANHGYLVIPIEVADDDGEDLLSIKKFHDDYITKNLGQVRFVPLTGAIREDQAD